MHIYIYIYVYTCAIYTYGYVHFCSIYRLTLRDHPQRFVVVTRPTELDADEAQRLAGDPSGTVPQIWWPQNNLNAFTGLWTQVFARVIKKGGTLRGRAWVASARDSLCGAVHGQRGSGARGMRGQRPAASGAHFFLARGHRSSSHAQVHELKGQGICCRRWGPGLSVSLRVGEAWRSSAAGSLT